MEDSEFTSNIERFLKGNPDDSQELSHDSYEDKLDKEIEATCDFQEYIDKLEVEDKTQDELLKMEKDEIIEFKNYQIRKYKAYIGSLEQEKQDLMENFKETTNILLERIKELEEKKHGERPQTAMIMNDIKTKKLQPPNYFNTNSQVSDNPYNEEYNSQNQITEQERCVKCKKYYPKNDFAKHSLECLRKPLIICKICKENIEENDKESHIQKYRKADDLIQAIKFNNINIIENYINHGFDYNQIIDKEREYNLLHLIASEGGKEALDIILKKKPNVNIPAKNNITPLVSYL